MTSEEIINEAVEDINTHFDRVLDTKTMYVPDLGVGLTQEYLDNIWLKADVDVYFANYIYHTEITHEGIWKDGHTITEFCLTAEEAARKLITKLQVWLGQQFKEKFQADTGKKRMILWRVRPEISQVQDCDESPEIRGKWYGYARLAVGAY